MSSNMRDTSKISIAIGKILINHDKPGFGDALFLHKAKMGTALAKDGDERDGFCLGRGCSHQQFMLNKSEAFGILFFELLGNT